MAASGPQFVLLALGVAFFLGAAHGLTPGHGKTLVAAYLVGSRGTVGDAVYLGSVVTVTHTASVFILGFLTLFASHYIVLDRIYPWLSVTSGLLVVGMGIWLLRLRLSSANPVQEHHHDDGHDHGHSHSHSHEHPHTHEHSHDDVHAHDHEHSHGEAHALAHDHEHPHTEAAGLAHVHSHPHEHGDEHVHSHDHSHDHGHVHNHEHEHAEGHAHVHDHSHEHSHDHPHVIEHDGHVHVIPGPGVSRWELLSLGVSGGLVPCPEAMVVLLMAVSLHRLGLGLVILTAFSLGLAAVLIAIGVALILSGPLMRRLSPAGWASRYLPVGSAVIVTVLGIGIVYRALVDARLIRF